MRKDSEASLLTLSRTGHHKAAAESSAGRGPSERRERCPRPAPEPPPRGQRRAPARPEPDGSGQDPAGSAKATEAPPAPGGILCTSLPRPPTVCPSEGKEKTPHRRHRSALRAVPSALSAQPLPRGRPAGAAYLEPRPPPAAPLSARLRGASRGGRGTQAAAGGLRRVPSPAPGISRPRAPLPSRRTAGRALPVPPGIPQRPRGPRSAPRGSARCQGGVASAAGCPGALMPGRSVFPRSPAPRPADPAPWLPFLRFPRLSRSVPALCLSVRAAPSRPGRSRSVPSGSPAPTRTRARNTRGDPAAPLPR